MKFSGPIGFAQTTEVRPGIWQDSIIERMYKGDVYQRSAQWNGTSTSANDDLNITNRISIVMDQFAFENFSSIKYIVWLGTCFKVKASLSRGLD